MPIVLQGDEGLFRALANYVTDDNFDFWTETFMALAINEACREIVRIKPNANYKRIEYLCAPNALQELPSEAHSLIDVEGVIKDGSIICAVKPIAVHVMNEQIPNWRNSRMAQAKRFIYEERKPRQFWIYPNPPAGQQLSLVYSYFPVLINENSTVLDFPESHKGDIINFVMWRCWVREGAQPNTAQYWLQTFQQGLGVTVQVAQANHPQDRSKPDNRDKMGLSQ